VPITGPTPGDRHQALHHGIVRRDLRDRVIGDLELLLEMMQQRAHGREGAGQARGQLDLAEALEEVLRRPASQRYALAATERAHHGHRSAARGHQGLPDAQLLAHLALRGWHAMHRPVRADSTCFGERGRIPTVGFDGTGPLPIHRRVIGIRDNDFMAQPFEAGRDPFALGRRFQQHFRPRPATQHGRESLPARPHAAFRDLAGVAEDVDLAVAFMQVDANMIHGWSPLLAPTPRVRALPVGETKGYHAKSDQPFHHHLLLLLRSWPLDDLTGLKIDEGKAEVSRAVAKAAREACAMVGVVARGAGILINKAVLQRATDQHREFA
jgi:hypothetical protein